MKCVPTVKVIHSPLKVLKKIYFMILAHYTYLPGSCEVIELELSTQNESYMETIYSGWNVKKKRDKTVTYLHNKEIWSEQLDIITNRFLGVEEVTGKHSRYNKT